MYQLAMNFDGAKHVSPTGTELHYKLLHSTEFPMLLPLHSISLHGQWLNERLTPAQVPPSTKKINKMPNTKVTDKRTLLIKHATPLTSVTEPD